MSIIIKQLSYTHPDRETLFQNISFTLSDNEKVSLIGKNGTGKSTFLRIISGELHPSSGQIIYKENPYFVPQHFGQYDQCTVAQALGISTKIEALHAILNGSISEKHFTALNDDWAIEERIKEAFAFWEIQHILPAQQMQTLSGGEKTKVFLSGIEIYNPSIILMDEPSNHLDKKSRQLLYDFIRKSNKTILIVSHDRTLLNTIDKTLELEQNEIKTYGGNYEFYKQQKEKQIESLEQQLSEKEKELRKSRKLKQQEIEKQNKRYVRGEKQSIKKGIPRIMMDTLKDKAESSSAKLKKTHEDKSESISSELKKLRDELPEIKNLKLNIENANLHKGKILISLENVNFFYRETDFLWENSLTFEVISGDRIVISGTNGSGKTTLIQLLLGLLTPQKGKINKAEFNYIYIDQEYSLLQNELSIYEQVQLFNERLLEEHELKILLNRFLFSSHTWDKKVQMLSGGEKMKLIFCCLIIGNNAPDLFILDEPTNNLDIQSLDIITSTLKNYEGTIILISHDQYFIRELNVNKEINL